MSTGYPRYKRNINKLPSNGWHCTVDGYDFRRATRAILISDIADFMKLHGIDGDAARLVEIQFCKDNPDLCYWGNNATTEEA